MNKDKPMSGFVATVFGAVLYFSLGATIALASDGSPVADAVPTVNNVLIQLAKGVGVGAILAFLFENFSWFQNISGKARWWIIFGSSVILPLLAQIGLQLVPTETWATIEPYWESVAFGFVTWAGSQVVHKLANRSSSPSSCCK
jgi:hypothetical protein